MAAQQRNRGMQCCFRASECLNEQQGTSHQLKSTWDMGAACTRSTITEATLKHTSTSSTARSSASPTTKQPPSTYRARQSSPCPLPIITYIPGRAILYRRQVRVGQQPKWLPSQRCHLAQRVAGSLAQSPHGGCRTEGRQAVYHCSHARVEVASQGAKVCNRRQRHV